MDGYKEIEVGDEEGVIIGSRYMMYGGMRVKRSEVIGVRVNSESGELVVDLRGGGGYRIRCSDPWGVRQYLA